MPTFEKVLENVSGSLNFSNNEFLSPPSPQANVVSTTMLANNRGIIRKKAFGNNVTGTCSAVATTIGLNYLSTINSSVMPPGYTPEDLSGFNFKSTYVKAEKFHKLISETYGMGTASYANGIVDPIKRYTNASEARKQTGLRVNWWLFASNAYVREQIDKGQPAMMTTLMGTNGYDFHTMLIYGYRKLSDGKIEYCVHPGWYGEAHIIPSGTYYLTALKWLPASYAKYSYKISIGD